MKTTITAGMALVLAISFASEGAAQLAVDDRESRATFSVDFGAFSPMTTFEDEMFGESGFETGAAIGVSAAAWITERIGVRAKVLATRTDGTNETSDLAPIAVNDPNQWSFTAEATARQPFESASFSVYPYIALGAGMRHYTWAAARRNEDKFFALTGALGAELRPAALGPFGIVGEIRGYRSQFRAFGIHGGNWRPGTRAREGTDIGFYGGVVDKLWSHDLLFTVGLSYNY